MALKLNDAAFKHAEALIEEGKYRINTVWREAQPSENEEKRFLDQHGWEDYGKWFLAVDNDAAEGSLARYKLPVGDFKSVHRSGLLAAKARADKNSAGDVSEAVDELIFLFDRISAC
jgi:hypothetical protein